MLTPVPEGPPPPPPLPPKAACCRWSIRLDPFDLIFRRLSFEGEVAIIGPLALEFRPMWIWGSPDEYVDASGFAFGVSAVFYPGGKPMDGFWLKAYSGYETMTAIVTHPTGATSEGNVSSPIFGLMLGSSNVFGRTGGFILSGGAGIGVATSDPITIGIEANDPAFNQVTRIEYTFYDKASRIKLLTSLALGIAF